MSCGNSQVEESGQAFSENFSSKNRSTTIIIIIGDARGVMVIVIGNGHGDTSSNPGRD